MLSNQILDDLKSIRLEKNYFGRNFFHFIALSGNVDAIRYALSDQVPDCFKSLRSKKCNDGSNFFHYLAHSENVDAIRYMLSDEVPDAFKAMRLETDNHGRNFFHYLAQRRGAPHVILFFITEYPELAAKLWVKDNKGYTPDSIGSEVGKTPSTLLAEAVAKIINEIADNSTTLSEKNRRLLVAFKSRVFDFLKRDGFISDETQLKLIASSVLTNIFGSEIDQTLHVVFDLEKCKPKNLSELSLSYLITAIGRVRENAVVRFFKPNTAFDELILKLNNIHEFILRSHNDIRDAVCVLKLLFSDPRRGDLLTEDQKHIFFALRKIMLNIEEVSALLPRPVEKRDGELPESNFSRKLDEIDRDMLNAVSSNHVNQARLVLNGIRNLTTDFEKINAFAKSHPQTLYFLDESVQRVGETERGHLPFHLENYGVDEPLHQTLLRIVREYIAAFDVAKEAGQLTKFFDITIAGNCLDGRTRDLVTWAAEFSGLKTLHELMGEYTQEFQAYHRVFENPAEENTEIIQFIRFVMQYHAGEHYKGCADILPGKITESVVQQYAETTLCYEDKQCRCVVQ